jgi:hypothetical protein
MSETDTAAPQGGSPPKPSPGGGLPFQDRINEISTQEPWLWLATGWRDLKRAPGFSLGYGALFVATGYAVTFGL